MIIDQHNFVDTSKYPMHDTAQCSVNAVLFPYKDIISLVIQSPKLCLHNISTISLYKDCVRLYIKQYKKTKQFICSIKQNTRQAFLLDSDTNTVAGNINYNQIFYNDLRAMLNQLGTQLLQNINSDALLLDLSCVTLFKNTQIQTCYIGSRQCSQKTRLMLSNNVSFDVDKHAFNVFSDCPLNRIKFNPYSIKHIILDNTRIDTYTQNNNKQLLLKPSALSDLRVVTQKDNIKFVGSIDA